MTAAATRPVDTPFLADRLRLHAARDPDAVAFRFLGRPSAPGLDLTRGELATAALAGAGALASAGLAGCQVGLVCASPRDFVVALAATLAAGAVAVPMPATLNRRSAPRIRAVADSADLAGVVASASILSSDWFGDAVPGRGVVRLCVEDLACGDPARAPAGSADPQSPCLLQFTSGSTGAPSGIMLSHANIAANAAAIAGAFGLDERTSSLAWLPLHHDMGLVGHVLVPMFVGFRSTLMDPLRFLQRPLGWLEAIGREASTITSAPNFAYELCVRAAASDGDAAIRLDTLTTMICGGEPVLAETLERFMLRFVPRGLSRAALAPCYGMAEATLLVSAGRRATGPLIVGSGDRKRVDLGSPVAGIEIRIVDPVDRRPAPAGSDGEIQLRGSSVGRCIGAPDIPDGWHSTGDIGALDANGLTISGRLKEMLILRGQNVFPADAESAALGSSPDLVPGGVAAVGIPHEGSERMIVLAEVRGGRQHDGGLRRTVSEAVAASTGHAPADVVLVSPGTLPRTTSGKLRRGEIAASYRAGLYVPAASPVGSRRELLAHA